ARGSGVGGRDGEAVAADDRLSPFDRAVVDAADAFDEEGRRSGLAGQRPGLVLAEVDRVQGLIARGQGEPAAALECLVQGRVPQVHVEDPAGLGAQPHLVLGQGLLVRVAGSGDVDELGVGVEAEFPCRLRRSRNLGDADGAALAHLGAPDGGEEAVDGAKACSPETLTTWEGRPGWAVTVPLRRSGVRAARIVERLTPYCFDSSSSPGKASLKSPERILDSRSSRTAAHSG